MLSAGIILKGIFGVSPGNPLSTAVEDFRRIYEERTGGDPNQQLIAEAFDGAIVIALAIEKAGSDDPVAVRDALRPVSNPPARLSDQATSPERWIWCEKVRTSTTWARLETSISTKMGMLLAECEFGRSKATKSSTRTYMQFRAMTSIYRRCGKLESIS